MDRLCSIEIISKGKAVHTIKPDDGKSVLQASGSRPIHPVDDAYSQATTNPVWALTGDTPVGSAESAHSFMRWIDKLLALAREDSGWR
jgi:hypothetical protein